jgi:N-acetylglucosamine transport system substrate-binding protein
MTNFSADWSRRKFLRGALATGALALPGTGILAGCATSGGGQEQSSGAKTDTNPLGVPEDKPLEIYIFNGGFGDKYATGVHEPMYKKRYPKAKIDHNAEVDIKGALQPRFVGGNPPDFVNDSGDGQIPLGELVANGQLYDLSDLYDAPSWDDPDKKVKDTLVSGAVEQNSFDGKPLMLQMALTVYGIWYNQALFEDKGWKAPTTWAEMMDLCAEIKGTGMAPWTYQGIHARYMSWPLMTMAAKLAGNQILVDIDNLKEGCFNNDAIKESANALQSLKTKGYILDGTEGMDHIQSQGQWSQGKAAFVPCGSWLENEQKDVTPEGFKMACMAEPSLSSDDKMPAGALRAQAGEPYIVPAQAKNPRGGMEYMRIMMSKEGAKGFVKEVSSLTIVEGSADGVDLPPGLSSAKKALDGAGKDVVFWNYQNWYGKLWNPAINTCMSNLMSGRATVDEFVAQCEAEVKKVRDDASVKKYKR